MSTYVLRRLLLFVPTLVGASILIFVLLRLVPGDIAEILVYQTGSESSAVQRRQIQQIRRELGLDRPIAAQYGDWVAGAVRGDFGQSYVQRRPVADILRRLGCARVLPRKAFPARTRVRHARASASRARWSSRSSPCCWP